jgi:hypothetical protein
LLTPLVAGCLLSATQASAESRFADVWQQIKSDPYSVLPQHEVTLASFVEVSFRHFPFFHDALTESSGCAAQVK